MTLAVLREPVSTRTDSAPRVAITILGLSLAVIVGWDGSLVGRVVRAVVVLALTVACAIWVTEARPSTRAWIQLFGGLVGTTVGLGIGLPHLTHGDFDAAGLAGLVALVVGGWLLGVGTIEVVRVQPGWRKALALPVAVLIAVFAVWPVSMALYATNLPTPELDTTTPADRGLTFFDAQFSTDDGVQLSGWYVPSRNGGAVVLVHDASSTRSELLDYAIVLARHGYGVLLYDARGHGRSGGRAMEYGWLGAHDVSAAVTYTSQQLDVHPGWVGVVGVGLGGEQALSAAAQDKRIRAVVADGATGHAPSDSGWLPKGPMGWVRRGVDAIAYGSASLISNAAPPDSLRASAAAAAPSPVLLIAGDGASAKDEGTAARWIQGGAPGNTQLWTSAGAGRGEAFSAHPDQWESVVSKFLDAHLLHG